jgi:hypothetical protein
MTSWTFDMKFPLGTQFTFGSLTFAGGEGGGGRTETSRCYPRASVRASHSYSLIYIGQYLLRFGSFCRVIHSQHQARSGYFDRDVHPPAIHRSTKFIFNGIVPQPRFI